MDDFIIVWEGDYYVIAYSPNNPLLSGNDRYNIYNIHGKWAGVTCHTEPGIGLSTYHTSNGQPVGDYVYITSSDRYDIEQQCVERIDEHTRTQEIAADAASARRHHEVMQVVVYGVGAILLVVLQAPWVWWLGLFGIAVYTDMRTTQSIERVESDALQALEKSVAFVDNRRIAARELLRAIEKLEQLKPH